MAPSQALRASSADSVTAAEDTCSPSSRRSDESAARSRALTTSAGAADAQTPGTERATSAGLKLKNVAATTPGPTAPIGAARWAKYWARGFVIPSGASSSPTSGTK